MAFPDSLLAAASTWFSNALITAAKIQANITDPLNTLASRVTGIGQGYIADATSATLVTLSATSPTAFAGQARITFTLTTQRRIRIVTKATVQPNTASVGTWDITAGYNSGSSAVIGSWVQVGQPDSVNYATVRPSSIDAEGTVLLAAGTYTAYGRLRRISGGDAGDQMGSFYTAVVDEGSS